MFLDWLRQRASLTPERLALACGEARWSFRELDERVTAMAGDLHARGVAAGAHVAVLMRNGAPLVTAIYALSRLGAVLVPLNTRLTPAELRWQLADSQAARLLHDDAHAAVAQSLNIPCVAVNSLQSSVIALPPPSSLHFSLDQPHSIIYTSGTTGQPKGAVLTFGNHWWSAVGSALNLGLHADDRWLACLPLFHIGGLAILLRGVIYGIPVIVHESFDPVAVNAAIDDERVTIISVVGTMLQRMLEARGARPYPPALRCVLLGGGPAPGRLLEECARRGVPVVQTYGLTEAASQVATLAPEDALRKLGSAGKPLFPTEVKIEHDEILVRGPTVMAGYWQNPEATARVLRDGWLHTGDLGALDDEGYLYVLDRRDDLIISGGENVYPAEVEAVLLSHPAVAEAGVTGLADEVWGMAPAAFIVRRGAVAEDELRAFCAERLARYKIPARFTFVDSLPRNAAGKLLRRELTRLL
jgi:O-succinylbenzoic acid--CoA ligase